MRVGSLLFTAGQPGIDPGTGAAAGETFEARARKAIANLRAVLEDAGSGLERVVKTTCFVADATAFAKLNELYAEYFPSAPPAVRSTPIVSLPRGLVFSIEAVALVGDKRRLPNKRLQPTRARPRSRAKSAGRARPRG
jgi:2-iminobutanoate/2-iminopropanoate deaminase